jgi:hypothetical protein
MYHMHPLRLHLKGSAEADILGEAVEEAWAAGMGMVAAEDEGGSA